jgi:hypothetical protein
MGKKRNIICDRTEIILVDTDKKSAESYNFTSEQVSRIEIDKHEEVSWFKKIPSEKIAVYTRKRAEPFVYVRGKNKQYFDEYKRELEKFAREHRIIFNDLTQAEEA